MELVEYSKLLECFFFSFIAENDKLESKRTTD